MKKTPKILPTFYKSKGTPIFRDTTALPFAKGGPLAEEPVNPVKPTNPVKPGNPVNPVNPVSWNRVKLSPEMIAAIKEIHEDFNSILTLHPDDLLFYHLNKEAIDQADSFMPFMDPSYPESHRERLDSATMDIKRHMNKLGWVLDTKDGSYFKVPKEILDIITRPEPEPLEELPPLPPGLISRNIPTQLSLPPQPEIPQYQMPGYMKSYNFPTVGRYTPLAAKAVQKATGYDRNFMEGYYDEEGNYVPGELENAREQNRAPQFQGASSIKDIFAQKAYQQALEESKKTKSFANGGTIHFERSEYGSDAREQYADGGNLECPPGYVNVNGTCVPTGSLERGPVEQDSADFLIKMANSPLFADRYNAMINATAKPEEIEAYRQSIINNVNNVAFWPLGKEADNTNWPEDADYIGYYGGQGQVETDKFGLSHLPEDLNNPNRFNVGEQEHVMFRNTASPTMTSHEFSHASTLGDRLPATVKIPFSKDPAKKEYVKFFSQDDFSSQTENKAYLDETRKYLYDKGIYDPTTKVFDEADYDNLIKTRDDLKLQLEQDPKNQELKLLMDSFNKNTLPYDKPTTIKLFNSYVQNTPTQTQGVDNLAMGMSNQMSGGGPIYTYSKRPGSYYQRADDGSWMINNSSTGGQYVPINDPTGQRTALLNKNAVVYNAPAQGAAKPVMNQAVWNKAQQQGKNDIAAQQIINASRKASGTEGLYMPDGSLRPQAAQAADWVPQALVAAPMALDVLGTAAAAEIPFTGGVNLGGVANAAGIAYGATQVDDRYRDWQNVASGKMDWKEAALKTGLTSLDFAGAGIPIKNATNIVKGINAPTKLKGQTLIGSPTKKVMGTINEFGDYTNASGVTVYGSSSSVGLGKNLNKAKKTFNNEAPSISLEDWKEANKIANSTNQRFIIPKGEEKFLVNKYTEEFANKFGIPVEKVNPKDVGLYAKLKEAEFIPTRETVPVERQFFPDLSREIHTNFIQKHKPDFNLKKQEELVLDAYARGYDRSINLREPDLAAQFYQDEVAPILEQTILQNKFKEPQTLIRGTRNFDIENGASVIRNGETIEGIKFSDLQPGDLFVPKTFTSTSIVKDAPKTKLGFEEPLTGFTQRAENLDYVINAPAGQSYLYANASPIQQFPREMEAILPKDLQFKLDKVASDVERGYLTSMNDVQKGELYKGFTKMPNKYFPSISSLDKIVDFKGKRIPKKQYPALIEYHNMLHQPSVPKYYFSIANPYLFGGRLNKNC